MQLEKVTLRHFRNLEAVDWTPSPGLNLVWGDNGQGKTNLLEGIHVALTGRSFRTRRDEELLPWGRADDPADPTLVQAGLVRAAGRRRLRVLIGRGFKRAFADAQWLARLGDLLSEAAVVTFTPEDAGLMKGSPGGRRRLLDMVLSQLSPAYLAQLQRYTHALRQLNAAYKLRGPDARARDACGAYVPLVAEAGAGLMTARARRLAGASSSVATRHAGLGGSGRLELIYDPDLKGLDAEAVAAAEPDALAAIYRERLERAFDEARRYGTCPMGAHRDDFAFRLGGQDLRRFGSQGQHRLAALTLKLESAGWIEETIGETPILLLDDFGSELDPGRRTAVLEGLRASMQVLITATTPADLGPAGLFDQALHVDGGRVSD